MSMSVQTRPDAFTHRDQPSPPSYTITLPSLLSVTSLFLDSGREASVDSGGGVNHHRDEDYNRDPEDAKRRDLGEFAERVGSLLGLPLYTPVIGGTCGGEDVPDSTFYNHGGGASSGGLGRMDEERLMVHTTSHGTPVIVTQEREGTATATELRCSPRKAVDPVFSRAVGGGRGEVVMVNESSCSKGGKGCGADMETETKTRKERSEQCGMLQLGDEMNCHSADHCRGLLDGESGCTGCLGQSYD